mmetsp:Transcript_13882/g.43492  ORF Transcript_13882/g.43492 Transcript_13882/m.43492 type:complete len:513 (+) Transcript_13882:122-1660(+)
MQAWKGNGGLGHRSSPWSPRTMPFTWSSPTTATQRMCCAADRLGRAAGAPSSSEAGATHNAPRSSLAMAEPRVWNSRMPPRMSKRQRRWPSMPRASHILSTSTRRHVPSSTASTSMAKGGRGPSPSVGAAVRPRGRSEPWGACTTASTRPGARAPAATSASRSRRNRGSKRLRRRDSPWARGRRSVKRGSQPSGTGAGRAGSRCSQAPVVWAGEGATRGPAAAAAFGALGRATACTPSSEGGGAAAAQERFVQRHHIGAAPSWPPEARSRRASCTALESWATMCRSRSRRNASAKALAATPARSGPRARSTRPAMSAVLISPMLAGSSSAGLPPPRKRAKAKERAAPTRLERNSGPVRPPPSDASATGTAMPQAQGLPGRTDGRARRPPVASRSVVPPMATRPTGSATPRLNAATTPSRARATAMSPGITRAPHSSAASKASKNSLPPPSATPAIWEAPSRPKEKAVRVASKTGPADPGEERTGAYGHGSSRRAATRREKRWRSSSRRHTSG